MISIQVIGFDDSPEAASQPMVHGFSSHTIIDENISIVTLRQCIRVLVIPK